MDRLREFIKQNTTSKLVKTALEVAKAPDLEEDMLIYIFKYILEENKEMEATIRRLLSQQSGKD